MRNLLLPAIFLLPFSLLAQQSDIYIIENGDSSLNETFVAQLCEAARTHANSDDPNVPSDFERLLNAGAGTEFKAEGQKEKVFNWWTRFGSDCHCEKQKRKFPAGNVLRQVVHSDFRAIVNYLGPHGRLSLNLQMPDSEDGLNILQWVTQQRDVVQEKYNNERLRFQKDKNWRRIIFYYMLFTEYQVQRDVIEEEKN